MSDRIQSLPELEGNFVQLPVVLLDILLSGNLARHELLVTLYLARANYAFDEPRGFVALDVIAKVTGLDPRVAEEALSQAIERGTALPFRSDTGDRFYLLNTEENRRKVNLVGQPEAAPAVSPRTAHPPAARSAPAPVPAQVHAPMVRSVSRRALERIVGLVQRDLTRDEAERLTDLGAPEELLMKAIDNLIAKNVEVYSSDLVIYEYESLASLQKRRTDEAKKRELTGQAKLKSRSCKRCSGLGYIFIGANTIKECDCRKIEQQQ